MTSERAAAPDTRSIVIEREVAGPPDEVWEALTTPAGLERWFPLEATVTPGEGGSIRLSWGPGAEGEAPIHAWVPPSHFGWTESHGQDEAGNPVNVWVDFHVEGREGTTVVRLVQSGLNAGSDWNEMYDSLVDGWTYFLFGLAYSFLKHRGKDRKLVWRRVATDLTRDAVWERLLGCALVSASASVGSPVALTIDESHEAEVVSVREGHHFTAALPELDDSLLFVELEGRHVGVWLSTYGMDEDRVAGLQKSLDTRVEAAFGA